MRQPSLFLSLLLPGALLCAFAAAPSRPPGPGAARRADVEADWRRQDIIRLAQRTPITTAEDAAGACDGVKDGKWGFHTNVDPQPWWQVDLGGAMALDRLAVYNRCDTADRTAHIVVLLSDDGSAWREVYRHDGTLYYGATDGKPLIVALKEQGARFVRLMLPAAGYLHLDEVEVYGAAEPDRNLALGRPADQSSVSQWSARHFMGGQEPGWPVEDVLSRGRKLLADLRGMGVDVRVHSATLAAAERRARALPADASQEARKAAYMEARWAVRRMALANPLLDFDRILFVKRAPGVYSHMSDQNYGWWSRPGGGICVLEGFKTDTPRVRNLTPNWPAGSFLSPELSYDGRKVLFGWCKYYPHVAGLADKENKANVPEDAFYHLYEMNVDGSGVRQLTRGKYDDFDGRYLPNGGIVFLSTRRGVFVQCGQDTAMQTTLAALPDSYVRCGGGPSRPVAVYTLHTLDAARRTIRTLSPFENFEWTPSVADDGRLLYARWDYVDRDNMPYMSLWSANPDGTNPQIVYGNFTRSPHCVFEARSIPGSRKLLFTASGHHSITGGSLCLLDPARGLDGPEPLTRMTPEVCFPEIEGWPASYYASPWPLSERHYLAAWSGVKLNSEGGPNPPNAQGLYLCDAYGNLELLYRDPDISSLCPIPLRSRRRPPVVSSVVAWQGAPEGKALILDVYRGLKGVERGTVKRLRIVGMPAKTQPTMNAPVLGVTRDDPGKFVLGTVPVEADGSAYFRLPAGVPVFFQALDADGAAVQTMRSLTCVQPKQTLGCVGCHEPRNMAAPNVRPLAVRRAPSRLAAGPEGSWPLRFDRLVQPVLDRRCVPCHQPGSPHMSGAGARYDLTPPRAWESLLSWGSPSLRDHVMARYREGRSLVGSGAAQTSPLLAMLRKGHHGTRMDADDLARLTTWMDTYGQAQGAFSPAQEAALLALRERCAGLLER